MTAQKPWEQRWKITEPLGEGGQGYTHLVESLAGDANRAVLKALKNNGSIRARGRMYREVAALRTVHNEGGKVPAVLGENTDEFEDESQPLYFVMEYVRGPTLAEHVQEHEGLSVHEAIAIALAVCSTVKIGHQQHVLHRDLKPEKIVLSDQDTPAGGVVIVDYGLSFNRDESDDLTGTDETFRNQFLILPENQATGGNQRDTRSDITAACGVFYFCLTAEVLGLLRDEKNTSPHRRRGFSVKEKIESDPRCSQIEQLLDRGFEPEIDKRFQSIDELADRLERLGSKLQSASADIVESPIDVANRLGVKLRQSDRKTIIRRHVKAARLLIERMTADCQKTVKELGKKYFAITFPHDVIKTEWPKQVDGPLCGFCIQATVQGHHSLRRVFYQVGSRGNECAVYRGFQERHEDKGPIEFRGPWEPLLWYDGTTVPEDALPDLHKNVDESLKQMMEELVHEALSADG